MHVSGTSSDRGSQPKGQLCPSELRLLSLPPERSSTSSLARSLTPSPGEGSSTGAWAHNCTQFLAQWLARQLGLDPSDSRQGWFFCSQNQSTHSSETGILSGGRDQSDVEPSWEFDAQGQVHQAHGICQLSLNKAQGHAARGLKRVTIVVGFQNVTVRNVQYLCPLPTVDFA